MSLEGFQDSGVSSERVAKATPELRREKVHSLKVLDDSRQLVDPFDRVFTYLRLSITDKCNFKCRYCLPNGFEAPDDPAMFLSTNEIRRLLRAFAGLGFKKVRFTGGEPTIRKDFLEIIDIANELEGFEKLALSTNGYRLLDIAQSIFDKGVRSLNISIDSLDREKFAKLTGQDMLPKILAGVEKAFEVGFDWIKMNAVYMRDFTEVEPFLDYIKNRPVSVRFIELMQTGDNLAFFKERHASANELHSVLVDKGWTLRERGLHDGPAKEFVHPDYVGRLGIIAPYSKDFCTTCNRLRVSARGRLKLCLFGNGEFDLRHFLKEDDQCEALMDEVQNILSSKKRSHFLHYGDTGTTKNLSVIGG